MMNRNVKIIACEFCLLFLLFQFFEKWALPGNMFGYPFPFLVDGMLYLPSSGVNLLVILVTFFAGRFLLKRFHSRLNQWGRLAMLANIVVFVALFCINAWFAFAHEPDMNKPGTTYIYNGGWPVPQYVIERPSEDEPERVPTGGSFHSLEIANLPFAFLLAILSGHVVHLITRKQNKEAEPGSA